MRAALVLAACLVACGPAAAPSSQPTASASAALDSSAACQPTTYRDPAGVLTANGVFGVLGDTSTFSDVAMNQPLVIVHRDAKEQDTLALIFNNIGFSSAATSVSYGVGARARPNPWGGFVFEAGWKPIAFAGSCWRVLADGEDTGLVLFVRP